MTPFEQAPERDGGAPRRLHPVAALLSVVRTVGSLLPLAVIALLTGKSSSAMSWMIPVFLGISLLEGIGGWWRFRYWVEAGEFRVERGFLVRRRSFVPLDRIHAVDVSAGIVQRLFGLVRLDVRTASAGERLELSAISEQEADRLQRLLTAREPAPGAATPPIAASIRLTPRELVLLASTSGQLGVMFSALAGVYSRVDDVIDERFVEYVHHNVPELAHSLRPNAWILLVAAGLLFTWILSFAVEIARFGGFSVARRGADLVITRGLLERREVVIPVRHVQAILVSEGLLRQPLGYGSLLIESAAHAEERGRSSALHPFLHRSRWRALLSELVPEIEYPLHAVQPPRRALLGFVLRPVLAAAVGLGAGSLFVEVGAWPWLVLAPAAWLGWLAYRDNAAGLEGRGLLLRWRLLARTTLLVPRARVQYAGLSQSLLQRRRGLVSFEIGTAGASGGRRFTVRNLATEQGVRLLGSYQPGADRDRHPAADAGGGPPAGTW